MNSLPIFDTDIKHAAIGQSCGSGIMTGSSSGENWLQDQVRHDGCSVSNCHNNTQGKCSSLLAREWMHWCVAIVFMAAACVLASLYQMGRIQAVLFVAAGACAGYFTNDLAITMLLWPTEKKFYNILHGVFFKRRDEFGGKLIKTAREQVLNDRFFEDMVKNEKVEIFLQEFIEKEINGILKADIGNPQTVLEKFFQDESIKSEFVDRIAAWSGNYLSRKFVEGIDGEVIYSSVKHLQQSADGFFAGFLLGDGKNLRMFLNKWVPEFINRNSADKIAEMLAYLEKKIKDSDKRLQDVIDVETRKGFETAVLNYLQTEALSAILYKLKSPLVRQQLCAFLHNEAANLAENYLHRLSGLKVWLLRVFGSSNIDALIEDIPRAVDKMLLQFNDSTKNDVLNRYLAELSTQLFPNIWGWKFADIYRHLPGNLINECGQFALNLTKSTEVQARLTDWISGVLKDELICSGKTEHPSEESSTDELLKYLSNKVEKIFREQSVRDNISQTVRIIAREHLICALNQKMGALQDFSVFKGEIVKTISGQCALLVLEKIRVNVTEVVQRLPVEEMLAGCWNNLSNRQIQQQVQGVLRTEFQILVNLGISFGSFVAFILITVQNLTGAFGALIFLIVFIPIYKFTKSHMRVKG